jgi:hypothetical protein
MITINKKILSLFMGASLFLGCDKVLDVTPYVSFSDATAFTSPQRILLALNGVYDGAQSGFYVGNVIRGYPSWRG